MNVSISIAVKDGDRPQARMGGTDGTIPVLELHDMRFTDPISIQFRRDQLNVAEAYLTALIAEATTLRKAVQEQAAMQRVPGR